MSQTISSAYKLYHGGHVVGVRENWLPYCFIIIEPRHEKTCLWHMQTAKA